MRVTVAVGTMILLVFFTGCRGSNQSKAEQLAQQLIAEMNNIASGLENGDKAAVMSTIAKLNKLTAESKSVKVTRTQDDAIKKKFETQLNAAQDRMISSIFKAQTGGKFTPADLDEIGKAMKQSGK